MITIWARKGTFVQIMIQNRIIIGIFLRFRLRQVRLLAFKWFPSIKTEYNEGIVKSCLPLRGNLPSSKVCKMV